MRKNTIKFLCLLFDGGYNKISPLPSGNIPEEAQRYVRKAKWMEDGYVPHPDGDRLVLSEEGVDLLRKGTAHLPPPEKLIREAAKRRGLAVEFYYFGYNSIEIVVTEPKTGWTRVFRYGE